MSKVDVMKRKERCLNMRIMFYAYCLVLVFCGMKANAQDWRTMDLRNGDLLFNVVDTASTSDFSRSIVRSTNHRQDVQVNHVAIVCLEDSGVYVLEATGLHGVWKCPVDTFMAHAGRSANGKPLVLHGRVKGNFDVETSIHKAKQHLGKRYDYLFSPSDDEFYCSELVQKSYVDKFGELLFPTIPMSFHDETGKVLQYWIDYYAKRGLAVPEGEPGSNPAGIMKMVDIVGK